MSAPASTIERYAPGSFCWAELGTSDGPAAKSFYGTLFGWVPQDMPAAEGMVYTILQLDGKDVAALYQLDPNQGTPPHWLLYVSVEKVEDAAEKAKSLGAAIVAGPMDVMDVGRLAVIRDPQGATLALWEAKSHIGARIGGVNGTMRWPELATTDAAKAREFYSGLFGWGTKIGQAGPPGQEIEYTEWQQEGRSFGGLLPMGAEWGPTPPHWMPYFMVADCAATTDQAKGLGGHVMVPPTPIPNVGVFAVLRDPQGAVFSLIQLQDM